MTEQWKDIKGFEGRYQISNTGKVKAIPFKQRYLLRNGKEAFRLTKERLLCLNMINSGYQIVHLYLDNQRSALLVHRLVAEHFLSSPLSETVNHKNGIKTDNRIENLEWATYTENHLHAVAKGLNKQAIAVTDPITGKTYDSIAQAAKGARKSHRKVRATFIKEQPCTQ